MLFRLPKEPDRLRCVLCYRRDRSYVECQAIRAPAPCRSSASRRRDLDSIPQSSVLDSTAKPQQVLIPAKALLDLKAKAIHEFGRAALAPEGECCLGRLPGNRQSNVRIRREEISRSREPRVPCSGRQPRPRTPRRASSRWLRDSHQKVDLPLAFRLRSNPPREAVPPARSGPRSDTAGPQRRRRRGSGHPGDLRSR